VDLTLTDDQAMLADSARAFTARECPPSRVRAAAAAANGFDADLWASIAALGWPGLVVAEDHGGGGAGLVELAVCAEALGRGPVPSPLLSSAVASLAIGWAGDAAQRRRWLPALATGAAVGTVAAVEPPPGTGTWLLVPWAAVADVLVVVTADGLHLVEGGGAASVRHDDLGPDPLFAVDLGSTPAEPLGDGPPTVAGRLADAAAVVHLAYALGAGERALELSVEHARTRHQFGRPIGSFQAVAHRCVDMRTDLDACRYLAYRAAWALDRGDAADLEVASALAYATDALRQVLVHAHQVHGAIGFSTEHDLHLYTRAAKAFELTHGGTAAQLERVATAMGLG
jgi:alkylation response protein AidB-like acyl-CoA dehydrogenase